MFPWVGWKHIKKNYSIIDSKPLVSTFSPVCSSTRDHLLKSVSDKSEFFSEAEILVFLGFGYGRRDKMQIPSRVIAFLESPYAKGVAVCESNRVGEAKNEKNTLRRMIR